MNSASMLTLVPDLSAYLRLVEASPPVMLTLSVIRLTGVMFRCYSNATGRLSNVSLVSGITPKARESLC